MDRDEEFEAFLRRFEPNPPASLPGSHMGPRRSPRRWSLLAAAAAVLIAVGLVVSADRHSAPIRSATPAPIAIPPGDPLRRGLLNLEDSKLGDALDAAARDALPDPSATGRALHAVAAFSKDQ